MAQAALEAGYAVHRVNLRSCGGTEQLCKTLYHAGLTADLHSILNELAAEGRGPMWAVGYSLGGNVVLKLAGELGESAGSLLRGVAGVCTPIDLSACAGALERLQNRVYELRFVRNMKRRMRERHRTQPDLFPIDGLDGIRTVRGIDDRITGPMFGFGGAAGYYGTQSAINFVDRIRIPTLLLFTKDDPMVPASMYAHPAVTGNPHIRLMPVEHGGHLGFLAADPPRFWLDGTILAWIDGTTGEGNSS
jgi:predicted alpha/beta-fold hydrolase